MKLTKKYELSGKNSAALNKPTVFGKVNLAWQLASQIQRI